MTGWTYRVVLHDRSHDPADHWFGIHNVRMVDGAPVHWTRDAAMFTCGTDEGPEGVVRLLEAALSGAKAHPALLESELPR